MNSEPLSESIPRSLNGSACSISFMASSTPVWPLPIDGAAFHPGCVNVGDVERMDELALLGVARVRDQIGFGETGSSHIPGVGLDGDVVLQQCARLGTAVESFFEKPSFGLEPPVDGRGTDRKQLSLDLGRERKALLRPGQPQGQKHFESWGARVASGFPDQTEHGDHLGRVARGTCFAQCGGLLRRWAIEQTNSVFAVVAAHLAKLVEDQGSDFLGSFAVTGVDGFEIFPFGLLTHDDVTLPGAELLNHLWVTFQMSQRYPLGLHFR
jgi:hypothetical protein